MATSLAMLTVCRSVCDLISIWVMGSLVGSTIDASRVGLPVICEPFVYIKYDGSHVAWNCVIGVLSFHGGTEAREGKGRCMHAYYLGVGSLFW